MTATDKLQFEPISCLSCGRPNSPSASRCLWCGIPMMSDSAPSASFATTTVELDYLDGIERFDNPAPVRLTIRADGVEMKEILPGTRSFFLAADAIIDCGFTDASVSIEQEEKRSLWGWLMLGSESAKGSKKIEEIKYDYILTIQYQAGEAVKTAVFHREDSLGFSYVKNVANIINALVKSRELKS